MSKPTLRSPASTVHHEPEEEAYFGWCRRLPNLLRPKRSGRPKEHGSVSRRRGVAAVRRETPTNDVRSSRCKLHMSQLLPDPKELRNNLSRERPGDMTHPRVTRECITHKCLPLSLHYSPEKCWCHSLDVVTFNPIISPKERGLPRANVRNSSSTEDRGHHLLSGMMQGGAAQIGGNSLLPFPSQPEPGHLASPPAR
jgi:hypothetical protein